MKNHIRNITGIIIILLSLTQFSCKTSQKVTVYENPDENRIVYWFYVYLREVKVENTDLIAFELQRLNTEPEKGTFKEYDYLLWKNLSEGKKFAVGPFNEITEAENALVFYKIKDSSPPAHSSFDKDKRIYWFVLNVLKRERSKSWELERIPGAIASGTYSDFENFLKDNLKLRIMTVGPFLSMPDAEESKRIYRLH